MCLQEACVAGCPECLQAILHATCDQWCTPLCAVACACSSTIVCCRGGFGLLCDFPSCKATPCLLTICSLTSHMGVVCCRACMLRKLGHAARLHTASHDGVHFLWCVGGCFDCTCDCWFFLQLPCWGPLLRFGIAGMTCDFTMAGIRKVGTSRKE